ncbi:MAG: T9SS type A sorting domain-containing protein, partial [bacterium]|nr:T9SS type A sorting domain-containing protein [bacterium]
ASNVRAVVYDVLGREVAKLADASFSAGSHQLSWAAAEQATGIYFLRFETLGQIETRKLMLIK